MKKCFIVEDSSFVVALMNQADSSHTKALSIYRHLKQYSGQIRIIIPTTVIFESLFALIRIRIPVEVAQEKLWKLLMISDILNVTIIETTAIRFGNKIEPLITSLPSNAKLPANDLIVLATAIEYENALVLTFDKKMKTQFNSFYPDIYYCIDRTEENNFFSRIDSEI